MKIILSRKGYDSKYGGGCGPILPDGKLLSIPIPSDSEDNGIPYSELKNNSISYLDIMRSLKIKIPNNGLSHLDPDLIESVYPRIKGWRGIFGQSKAASTHLYNYGVSPGDIFLFFGSFRKVGQNKNGTIFFTENKIQHIIFGYLVIDEIIELGDKYLNKYRSSNKKMEWAFYHPHLINDKYGKKNKVFIAKKNYGSNKGYGTFFYNDNLVLSSPDKSRSVWKLPSFFHYNQGTSISRHNNISRYGKCSDYFELKTVGIGQEFVISGNDKVVEWANKIIENSDKYY